MTDDRTFEQWLEDEVLETFKACELGQRMYRRKLRSSQSSKKPPVLNVCAIADVIGAPGNKHRHAKEFGRMREAVQCHHVVAALRRLAQQFRVKMVTGYANSSFSEVRYQEVNLLDALAQASASGSDDDGTD